MSRVAKPGERGRGGLVRGWARAFAWASVGWVGVLTVVAFGTGCYSYTPARESRAMESEREVLELPPAGVAELERLRAATPESIYQFVPAPGRTLESVKESIARELVSKPHCAVVFNEVVEGTLVRMLKMEESRLDFTAIFQGFSPNGYVLTERYLDPGRRKLQAAFDAAVRKSIDARWEAEGVVWNPLPAEIALDEGMPFRVPESLPPNCRGVVLHLWAVASNDYEKRVVRELVRAGWLVLDLKTETTVRAPVPAESVEEILALEEEQRKLGAELPRMERGELSSTYQSRLRRSEAYQRQVRNGKRIAELRYPAVVLCDEAGVDAAAEVIARRVDDGMADCARAGRAVVGAAKRRFPELEGKPVVVIGFSAGALTAPTVSAALGADAVVVVGGAANIVGITRKSAYSKGGVVVVCDGAVPREALMKKLERAYLERTRLDAYVTAPLLRGVPVLVVDAGLDTWVPAEYGAVLYERLGRPDRLHMALGGHGMLFYFLPRRGPWIADWVNTAVDGTKEQTGSIR